MSPHFSISTNIMQILKKRQMPFNEFYFKIEFNNNQILYALLCDLLAIA